MREKNIGWNEDKLFGIIKFNDKELEMFEELKYNWFAWKLNLVDWDLIKRCEW